MRAAALLAAGAFLLGPVSASVIVPLIVAGHHLAPDENKAPINDPDSKYYGVFKEYASSYDMDLDPRLVHWGLARAFCEFQIRTCNHLCGYKTIMNGVSVLDLSFECICAHNQSRPGLEYYWGSLPNYACATLMDICIHAVRGGSYELNSQGIMAFGRTTVNDRPFLNVPEKARPYLEKDCYRRFWDKCGFLEADSADIYAHVKEENMDLVDHYRIKTNKPFAWFQT